jgi:hypothetical protein
MKPTIQGPPIILFGVVLLLAIGAVAMLFGVI